VKFRQSGSGKSRGEPFAARPSGAIPFFFVSQRNLISQASLVRAVGFAASIRTLSTRRETNPWASEETLSPSFSSCRERERGTAGGTVFVFSGTRRTYNKLKSHHPRDLVAITRPSSPRGWRGVGKCPALVSRDPDNCDDDDSDDRNNDGERERARARAPLVRERRKARPWGGSKMGKDLTADQRPSAF